MLAGERERLSRHNDTPIRTFFSLKTGHFGRDHRALQKAGAGLHLHPLFSVFTNGIRNEKPGLDWG